MSWGLRDVVTVFLRFLKPDQHLRGCNQQQLPSSIAHWKLLLLQVTCYCSWRSQLDQIINYHAAVASLFLLP